MKKNTEKGFSLIELILVVAIVGIISAMAVPNLLRARTAAENSTAIANLRTIHSEQVGIFSQKNRYGRLDEVNAQRNGTLGTWTSPVLRIGSYNYRMFPSVPTDAELQTEYTIIATYIGTTTEPYIVSLDHTGVITQITP